MNPNQPPPPEGQGQPNPSNDPGMFTHEVRYSQISARVPEKVSRGVFSTGVMVVQGPNEFVIDFVQRMTHPEQIAARIILPIAIMPSVIAALNENFQRFTNTFGAPPALPTPAKPPQPVPLEDIYNQLRLPDELLSGVYANGVRISHSPAEFCFDFITNFYPRSAVSCRVYLSSPQIPGLLKTLNRAFQQYQQKQAGNQPPPPSSGEQPGQS